VEGVEFDVFGTTDKQYFSLISYGAFYGKTEMFEKTGPGYTGENNPMYSKFNGASLQLGIDLTSEIYFFNEFTYKSRGGEFGKRTPYKIVYSEHSSDIFEYKGSLALKKEQNRHFININFENETLENLENVYKFESRPGGNNYIVYYDPLKVAGKERFGAKAEYVAYIGVKDFCPEWIFKGGVDYKRNRLTASVYPYYRKQNVHYTSYNLSAARNIIKNENMYGFSIDVRYTSGGGTAKDDDVYATPGENQTKPRYIDKSLNNEFEYLTTGQLKGDIGLKYSRTLNKTGIRGYTALHYSLTKAFNAEYLDGDNLNALTLTAGCTF
jgi:hypothetical protein